VVTKIYTNGQLAYDSGRLTGASATQTATVNVAGVQELVLVVEDAGDGYRFDQADWAGARLLAA
jgi:NPCBM/NEW2 domain